MVASITSTALTAEGRIKLVANGLAAAQTFYVFRRDSAGTNVVRETSEGDKVADSTGKATIYDYEPRQGESTDYLLTDVDGTTLATVRADIPRWGTWLKSPALPFQNTLTHLAAGPKVSRAARREAVQIEDSPYIVALASERSAPSGEIVLACRTATEVDAVTALLNEGDTLMLDCAPEWQVPFRYISVGDVDEGRIFEEMGLDKEWRLLTLGDVFEVAPPLGTSRVNAGATYDQLPTLYGTYAAIPATVRYYGDLVL